MRRAWTVAGALALSLIGIGGAPQPVVADHCWAPWVEPSRGPVGTVFVVRGDSGGPGIVTLFHDGSQAGRYRLKDREDEVRFRSTAADVGRWRAHLRILHGDQPCGHNDWFTVTAAPDTATVGAGGIDNTRPARDPAPGFGPLIALAALLGAGLAVRRVSVRRP